MKDHYSFLAPIYSSLANLVFGDELAKAKSCFVEDHSKKRVLVIGGGDGLDYREFGSHLSGEYWEISRSMLDKAKSNLAESSMSFHLGFFKGEKGKLFDEVWLHFVLDTMSDEEIKALLVEVKKSLKPKAGIYLADFFSPQKLTQQLINFLMITFFRVVAAHKRKNLPDYERIFCECGFQKSQEKTFLTSWVKAQLWRSF